MSKFKVGDAVCVMRKVGLLTPFTWLSVMDNYVGDGKVYTVDTTWIDTAKINTHDGCYWWFPDECLDYANVAIAMQGLVGAISTPAAKPSPDLIPCDTRPEYQSPEEALVEQRRALRRFLGG